mmetsp:Transcript_46202/g.108420  ORF Transcript_46202/g.108420 Transcript_46202/m.108420 type:complete len:332 (+) Transcript_46202:96-1091(+)
MPLPFFTRSISQLSNESRESRESAESTSSLGGKQCLTTAANSSSLEAKLFEGVLQNSTQRFSEELQLNTGEYVGAERPASVSPTAGEERVESDGSRKSSVSSRGRYKPTVEEETRGMDFTWTAITPENLALMEERELMKALQARNKGENDKVPGWLLDGLSKVAGPVDWLVKVDIPAGVKKGKKVKFICNNVEVETTYEGSSKSTGKGEVYVMQARVNKMAGRLVLRLAFARAWALDLHTVFSVQYRRGAYAAVCTVCGVGTDRAYRVLPESSFGSTSLLPNSSPSRSLRLCATSRGETMVCGTTCPRGSSTGSTTSTLSTGSSRCKCRRR